MCLSDKLKTGRRVILISIRVTRCWLKMRAVNSFGKEEKSIGIERI